MRAELFCGHTDNNRLFHGGMGEVHGAFILCSVHAYAAAFVCIVQMMDNTVRPADLGRLIDIVHIDPQAGGIVIPDVPPET